MRNHALFLGLLLSATAPSAAANLIVNGSFETPPLLSSTYVNHAVGASTLTGWQIVGPPFESLSQVRSDFAGNVGYSMPAQDGDVWLDLAGFVSNSPTGIMQTVATTPGATYDLSFWVGQHHRHLLRHPDHGRRRIRLWRHELLVHQHDPGHHHGLAAVQLQLSRKRCLDPRLLSAISIRPATFSAAIDNVSLFEAPGSAVPEPTSWLLLMCGFAGLGALQRASARRMRPALAL